MQVTRNIEGRMLEKKILQQPLPETRKVRAPEGEFFIDNLLVRIHLIIVMIRWTGLAPWEFEFPFCG